MKCFQEKGRPVLTTYPADLLDGGIVEFECHLGHKSRHMLQAFKFELLAEAAVTAIADGYYRESVSSFSSSLERFYEFYCIIVLRSKNYSADDIKIFWNKISRQSERQLGAFAMLFFTEEGFTPVTLPNSNVEFRNRVIHQGVIPTREEAIAYGQSVVDVINIALDAVQEKKAAILNQLVIEDLIEKHHMAGKDRTISTYGIPTLLSTSRDMAGKRKTVSDWLEHVKQMKDAMRRMSE